MAVHEALYFTKELRQIIVNAGEDVDEETIRIQARKTELKFERIRF